MPWKTFLKAHFGMIAATDFFTVEVLTLTGLVRNAVLFVIDLESRRVHIAGVVRRPHGAWMKQIARNLYRPCRRFPPQQALPAPRSRGPSAGARVRRRTCLAP